MKDKRCSRCRNIRSIDNFTKSDCLCNSCIESKRKAYHDKNPDWEAALLITDLSEIRKCNVCGEDKIITEYYPKNPSKQTGKMLFLWHCKECSIQYTLRSNEKYKLKRVEARRSKYWGDLDRNRKKARDRYKTPLGGFNLYRRNAKKRKIDFCITLDEFMLFWSKICVYCNEAYEGAGIDRVDSNIGYVLSNCVPACTICNHMKMAMKKEDFLDQCNLISKQNVNKVLMPYTFIA